VLNDAFDLFAAMGATDEQLDFPHLYASGKNGWATLDMAKPNDNLGPAVRPDRRPRAGARPSRARTSPSRSSRC
jgi:GTP-binding protein